MFIEVTPVTTNIKTLVNLQWVQNIVPTGDGDGCTLNFENGRSVSVFEPFAVIKSCMRDLNVID